MINQNYILVSSLLSSIKTENPLINFILSTLLMIIVSEIVKYKMYIYDLINEFIVNIYRWFKYKNKYSEIVIETSDIIYSDRHGLKGSKTYYSDYFQAITHYIKINKIDGIYSKIEPKKIDTSTYSTHVHFDIFIPNQDQSFLISSENNIYCYMKYIKKNNGNDESGSNKVQYNHKIILYSNEVDVYSIEKFLDNLLNIYNKHKKDSTMEVQSYFCFDYSEDDGEVINYRIKDFNTNKRFNTIFFEDKDMFLKQINFFLTKEDWYKEKGLPHHLGILLHGNPGCGKTSIIKAMLEYTGRHAFVIPLNRIKTCGELEKIFYSDIVINKYIPMSKRIYIFEDIDCVSNIVYDRSKKNLKKYNNDDYDNENNYDDENENENENEKNGQMENLNKKDKDKHLFKPHDKLNLGCILNILDGIIETPNRIIIMTTNYPKKLDKALLREGRIDINIELKLANREVLKNILQSFYNVKIENEELKDFKEYTISPAQIYNICQRNVDDYKRTLFQIFNT